MGRSTRSDDGFSLVEAVVALGLAAILILSLTYALSNGLNALRATKQFQQATALGTDIMEKIRDQAYETIVMDPADLAGDARVTGSPPRLTLTNEPLVADQGIILNTLIPHKTVERVNNEDFTVSRYVTWVDAVPANNPTFDRSYKRITVVVDWVTGRASHSYTASTLVTKALRGLATPLFDVAPIDAVTCHGPGGKAAVAFKVTNLGIVDTYEITRTMPLSKPLWSTAVLHLDGNGNDRFDSSVIDKVLVDTNDNSTVDTGSVPTNGDVTVFVVWNLQLSDSPGTQTISLGARSGHDEVVARDASATILVDDTCETFYLHATADGTPPMAQPALRDAAMNETAPVSTTLANYSTDLSSSAGRLLTSTAIADDADSNPASMVNWIRQVDRPTTYSGLMTATIWARPLDGGCAGVTVQAFLRDRGSLASDAGTVMASGTAVVTPPTSGPCDFQPLVFVVAIPSHQVAAGRLIELKLQVLSPSRTGAHLAYDTTVNPAKIELPRL